MRIAVVTPYFKENQAVLERCLKSVSSQSIPCDHILVSDGFPRDILDIRVRHLRLDSAHGDFGNIARGMGCLLAASERYEAIALLDADNWYDTDHLEYCLSLIQEDTDYVAGGRRFCRLDGSVMPLADEPNHIDTSCYVFLPGSYPLLAHWALMPKALSCVGDRMFRRLLIERGMKVVEAAYPTVNYTTTYAVHYEDIGETPPPECQGQKGVNVEEWRQRLSGRTLEIASRMAGVSL